MTRYKSGDWFAVVTPNGVALLAPTVAGDTLEQVWATLHSGGGVGAVIETLVGAFGSSLTSLPEFGVAVFASGRASVAVRGDLQVELQDLDGNPVASVVGAGVTTWSEQVVPGVARATLSCGAATQGWLLIADGIVRAATVEFGFSQLDESVEEPRLAVEEPRLAVEVVVDPGQYIEPMEPESPPRAANELDAKVDQVLPPLPPLPPIPPASGLRAFAPPPPPPSALPPEPDLPLRVEDPGTAEAPPPRRVTADTTLLMPEDEPVNEYDQLLFGATVLSSVEAAAVRESAAGESIGAGLVTAVPVATSTPALASSIAAAARPGDHDGETIMVDELMRLGPAAVQPVVETRPGTPPVMCGSGVSPVVLDRNVIVGTRPRFNRVQSGSAPTLVTVQSPSGEISRSHLELRVEGVTVLAVDLNSTNGTLLRRAGKDPVRMQPGEANLLVAADQLDLGDGVVLEFEGLT